MLTSLYCQACNLQSTAVMRHVARTIKINIDLTNEGTGALHHLVSHWSILEWNTNQPACQACNLQSTVSEVQGFSSLSEVLHICTCARIVYCIQ